MKILFSEHDTKEFEKLVLQMDDNEAAASFYNILLQGHEQVNEMDLPYPIKKLKIEEYLSNPYFLNVKPSRKKDGKVRIDYLKTKAHQGFVYDEMIEKGKNYEEITPFGYFEKPFEFLALLDRERIWMSVTPHEINTMKDAVNHAHGDVITLGLGIGYYAYMCLLKDDVRSVTAIERDPRVISIFKESILPFFPNKEKLRIIEADAIKYLEKADHFDYLFADLWHFAIDGLPLYLQINKFESQYPNSEFEYWIEPSMLILIRKALIILAEEEIHGTTDFDYEDAASISDEVINSLHFLLKDKTIENIESLRDMLSLSSLKELAKSLSLK